ncbi:phosphate ABC transporter substrate-binding protein PstS [Roseomonas sp. NAR14]|uniref:Phosphate-binding protein PstS n=2 Tax=Roseomonas acroporae TaxID=2937791 RepID=A0A9X1Y559_9PROT|nr:phosphate ABC transporter substrate-binding protein PstS [Roseomonas acroporae]MCK8783648.1 phosphate ABC transporter substrate-binding protein PstS [Roseomonas acroporae]
MATGLVTSGLLAAGRSIPAFAQNAAVTGAGATFPAPVYAKWGEAVQRAIGIQLNYQAIGSGGGQNQIRNRTVDFGASDAPLAADKLAEGKLLQFPTVMGSVVVIVNVPGVEDNKLRLTGELLAEIYQGKITKWNDPKLVEANAGLSLPNIAVAPVYRADGSGTSFVFTSYLSAVSPEWKDKTGAATSVRWPTGTGARGNDGIAGTVRNTRGAIGYVENAYATQNHLITTQLRNKAGRFVAPTMASFEAAAASADWSAPNFAASLIDLGGNDTWPIVSPTFILLPKDPQDATRSLNVMKLFDWAYTHGGKIAQELEYIPLPAQVQNAVRAVWKAEVKGPNGQPVWTA